MAVERLGRRSSRRSMAAFALALGLAACQENGAGLETPLGGTSATVGTLGGAAGGGLIGSKFGGGSGSTIATIAGTLAGGYLGHQLGESLDQADQVQAATAERQALGSNSPTSWTDPDTGASGEVTPMRSFEDSAGRECREYAHVITVQGRRQSGTGIACRQPSGNWSLVGG
jgi:surface antigen